MTTDLGIVLFGDVVRSRSLGAQGPLWLERLCRELDARYGDQRMASFEFTQGDEIQGLLRPDTDPFEGILIGLARPRSEAPPMRWAIVLGEIEPGRGPATRRSGPAFMHARETIEVARSQRDTLLVRSGDPETDGLLEGTAPVLGSLIARLTDRQRTIASLALVDGLRQADIAARLGVRRATVSVAFARADVRSLSRLLTTVRRLWAAGVARRLSAA